MLFLSGLSCLECSLLVLPILVTDEVLPLWATPIRFNYHWDKLDKIVLLRLFFFKIKTTQVCDTKTRFSYPSKLLLIKFRTMLVTVAGVEPFSDTELP